MAGQGGIPYQVALFVDGANFNCGGSIISPLLILTAAHCLDKFRTRPERVTVIAGTRSPSLFGFEPSPSEQTRTPRRFYIHPKYQRGNGNAYDIGMIELSQPLRFTKDVDSVCLPQQDDQFTTGKAIVSGWGRTVPGSKLSGSKNLQFIIMPIIPFHECQRAYGSQLKSHMFCIAELGKDACQGDSGSPAVCRRMSDKVQVLCGVVSWGRGCAQKEFPGVYIKVSDFILWMAQTLPENLLGTIECSSASQAARGQQDYVEYLHPNEHYDYSASYGNVSRSIYEDDDGQGYQDNQYEAVNGDNEELDRSASYFSSNQDIDVSRDYNNDGDQWENNNDDNNKNWWW